MATSCRCATPMRWRVSGECPPWAYRREVFSQWAVERNLRYNACMETKYVPAVFEGGKLRPLAPLDLNEHERVEVAIR